MRSKLILLFIAGFVVKNIQAQDFIFSVNDVSVKERCYLWVCSDLLSTGVAKMTDVKFDSLTVRQSQIVPLKSKGLNEELHFFRFIMYGSGTQELTYIFCFNHASREFYRIGKFMHNDYYKLIGFQKSHGRLTRSAIKSGKVYIEGIDLLCLYNFYKSKSGNRRKNLTETDRLRNKCLGYNGEAIYTF